MKQIILLLVIFLGIGQTTYSQTPLQEVVYLKNGSIIRGTIVEQIPNLSLKIATSDGSIFVYKMEEVEKITKERSGRDNTPPFSGQEYNISGYRGFVDFGYTAGVGDMNIGRVELTTSHGFQFNPYLFVGAGTGIHCYFKANERKLELSEKECLPVIPFFVDLRGSFLKGSIVPFIGIKLGYSCALVSASNEYDFSGLGLYIAPSAGVKFAITSQAMLNLSLGYSVQNTTIGEYSYRDYDETTINMGGVSIKMGVEF